jgi:ABC-2 type transport system permease protein
MTNALWAELVKVRRSRLPWVTVLAFVVVAGVGGLFMFILANPARARSLGLLGAKAQTLTGTADWPTYLGFLAQAVAVGGTMVFGLVVVWLFGREYSDHTAKDLLALPTARTSIVAAKFTVAAIWCLLLSIEVYVLGLAIGAGLRLPGWSLDTARHGLLVLLATAVMTVALVTPLALAASAGHGYLPAVGALFALVFSAQIVAILGYGGYFPWSVPALYSGLAGPDKPVPGPVGYALVVAVGIAGTVGTAYWWRTADHTSG